MSVMLRPGQQRHSPFVKNIQACALSALICTILILSLPLAPAAKNQAPPPAHNATKSEQVAAYMAKKLAFESSFLEDLYKAGFLPADNNYNSSENESIVSLFWIAEKEPVVLERLKKDLLDTSRHLKDRREEAFIFLESYRARNAQGHRKDGELNKKTPRDYDNKDNSPDALLDAVRIDQDSCLFMSWAMRLNLFLAPDSWTPNTPHTFWHQESIMDLWPYRNNSTVMNNIKKAYAANNEIMTSPRLLKQIAQNPEAYFAAVKNKNLLRMYEAVRNTYRSTSPSTINIPLRLILPKEATEIAKAQLHELALSKTVEAPNLPADDFLPKLPDGVQPNGLVVRRSILLSPEQREKRLKPWDHMDEKKAAENLSPEGLNLKGGKLYALLLPSKNSNGEEIAIWDKTPLQALANTGTMFAPWNDILREKDFILQGGPESPSSTLIVSSAPPAEIAQHLAYLSVLSGTSKELEARDTAAAKEREGTDAADERRDQLPPNKKDGQGTKPDEVPPLRIAEYFFGDLFLLLAVSADESELDRLFGPISSVWVADMADSEGGTWIELSHKTTRTSPALTLGKSPIISLPDTFMEYYEKHNSFLSTDILASTIGYIAKKIPSTNPELAKANITELRAAAKKIDSACKDLKVDSLDLCKAIAANVTRAGLNDQNIADFKQIYRDSITKNGSFNFYDVYNEWNKKKHLD